MKMTQYQKCVKRYNNIMFDICCEHLTIGTELTEEPEKKAMWNIRDMVAEAYYQLSCYLEPGNCRYEDRLEGEDEYKIWLSEKGKLERFIKAFDSEAMKCDGTFGHGSTMLYGKYACYSIEDLFLGAEQNEDFYKWLEDRNVTGDELAALIWACPSWDWLDGWYEKIEYWFDKPDYDDADLNVAWYNDFNCEKYMDVIVDLYKEYLDFDENNA